MRKIVWKVSRKDVRCKDVTYFKDCWDCINNTLCWNILHEIKNTRNEIAMKASNKVIVLARYHDGVIVEYDLRTAIARLGGYYKDKCIIKSELLAGRALHTPEALYYCKDWEIRSGRLPGPQN
jgi:hypothetical protein